MIVAVFRIHFLIYGYQRSNGNQARLSIQDCNTHFNFLISLKTGSPQMLSAIKIVKCISGSKSTSLHLYLNSFEYEKKNITKTSNCYHDALEENA